MRRLPPLNALKAFDAVARYSSVSQAAVELHVTHGAVSRHILALEKWLGVALFERVKSRLQLTEAGLSFFKEIEPALDRIEVAAFKLMRESGPLTLIVNAPPTFTMVWLIPRISLFQRMRPDISIKLTTSVAPIEPSFDRYDIAIRGDSQPLSGLHAVPFMAETVVPVCHPDLLEGGKLANAAALKNHTLITYDTEFYNWREWLASANLPDLIPAQTLNLEQMYFARQAASEGLGVALIPYFLIADDIATDRLCMPFGMLGARTRTYYANYSATARQQDGQQAFCAWLAAQGAETMQLCASLLSEA